MRKHKGFLMLMPMLLVLAIVLSACRDGKQAKEGKDPDKEGISPEASTQADQDIGEPKYGGSVVVGITQDLDSLDPHKAVAAGTKEVLFNVFEGLVKPDEAGNLIPAVAEDYEISSDGKVYTFTLRKGIKFHNGEPVTVNDIVYSIKRCAGLLDTTESGVVLEPALSNIKEVNKVDDSRVEIVLSEGDTELIGYLTCAIIPENYKDQNKAPVGTGPFRFVSYEPLASFLVEKNPDYWQEGSPYLDQVTFKISSDTDSAFLELKSGAIDIFPYLTDDQAQQLAGDYEIREGHMNLIQGLFLNNKEKPFDDPKVRTAINLAINREEVLAMVAGGRGTIIGSNMFPGFSKYYEEKLAGWYPYDPQKAKALLAEAGYEAGFTFTIQVPSNYQYHVDTTQVLAEQLKAVGINAKIQKIEWSQWLSEVYTNRNYQATVVGLDAKLVPRDVLDRYASSAYNNFVNYENPRYDAVLKEAIASIEDPIKVEKYKELQRILTEDAASVYIQDPALLVAVKKQLGGYTFYPVFVQDISKVYYKK